MNKIFMNFKNVYSSYDNKKLILDNINFNIKEKDFIALVGEKGSGRSSIIKTIYGICKKIKGDIIFNFDNRKRYNLLSNYVSVVLEKINNYYDLEVKDFIYYGIFGINKNIINIDAKYFYDYKKELFIALKVDTLIKQKKTIKDLSYLELMRVFLAQGLLKNPKILFLYENFSRLDIKAKLDFLNLFRLFYSSGTAFFVIENDIRFAYKFFNKIIFLKNGKIKGIFEKQTNIINSIEFFREKENNFLELVSETFDITKKDAKEYIFN